MLCSFPLLNKLHYNRPSCHSIDQASQEKKSRNLNSSSSHIIGSSSYGLNNRSKPIRTSNQEKFYNHQYPKGLNFYDSSQAKEKPKHDDDGFKKTNKSRDLKKVKQPISPGGRLSSFLNSLFTNGKKTKTLSNDEEKKMKSANASTCSSASSFSTRSCLSKNINRNDLEMDQQNVEAVKSINRNFVHEDHKLKFHKNLEVIEEYEDEDDGASCASSDLFELDNLFSIGLMELPVYETTNLATNASYTASEIDVTEKSPEQRALLVESRSHEILLLDNKIAFNEAIIEER
ncbi:hypothetical protein RND71_004508 [Anisodus tanguticus]|uniref:Uncharacterized protein n=1 Tax=Anisodus tanguticus TaxID=243964 RepID=A0AAE1SQD3_9SOLA|nr:hypothetical protein RND71_004508 [Anisodus tanguticus]